MNRSDIISNVLFWIVLSSLLFVQFNSAFFHHSGSSLLVFLAYNSVYIALFYVHYIVLVPKVLMGNHKYKVWIYLVAFLSSVAVAAFVKTTIQLAFKYILFKRIDPSFVSVNFSLMTSAFTSGFVCVSSLLLRITSDWFNNEKKRLKLELEHKDMELNFLRSQLNPHFLFNVLNNIYALAVQKSENTPEIIIKLSDMMRYMLYENNEDYVLLSRELDYISNYIELQKLRYSQEIFLDLDIYGVISTQKVIPLLLISFVENVFKHGDVTDAYHPASIEIICNPQVLHLTVKNKKNQHKKDKSGGVGMANVERRLELMYPGRYTFNVVNTPEMYASELIIEL